MARYFLGIDIGTSQGKGVIIDDSCKVVCEAHVPHSVSTPHPGWFEHDAEKIWWGDFCKLSHELMQKGDIRVQDIRCIGLSALGCDCVPVDEQGTALAPAILYGIDSRVTPQIERLSNHFAGEPGLLTHPLCTSDVAPKILWFYDQMPQIAQRAHKFLTGSSYLSAKLTGNFTIDAYLADSWQPLYDLEARTPDKVHCGYVCRPDQLATIANAIDVAGTVSAKAALETGLAEGTPVLVGTGDSGAEAISCGVFLPGDLLVQLGSTCFFIYVCDHAIEEPRLWPGRFVIPGRDAICAGTNTAGTLTAWIRDQLFSDAVSASAQGGEDPYALMTRAARDTAPGADGLICLPYFQGERTPINDPAARGTFFGLTLRHTRGHLVRAALEGIACSIAQHVAILEEDGLPVRKIVCTGGGTKNDVWLQAVSDVLERPIQTASVSVGAAYGDAIMAALAGGAYSNWVDLSTAIQIGRAHV